MKRRLIDFRVVKRSCYNSLVYLVSNENKMQP
jgi:hypothetical protein